MGLRTFCSWVLGPFGLAVVKKKTLGNMAESFVLQKYENDKGEFDYEKYRKTQEKGNKSKIENVWVREKNIEHLSEYVLRINKNAAEGVCHGTRRGLEQEYFKKYTKAEVFGTEISDTATEFPNTIQWDFHETNPEWVDRFDFVYSNSLDHAYDPEKALNAWMSSLKPGGLCFIEHTDAHTGSGATQLDPFGADLQVMPFLIALWGKGQYGVRRILTMPDSPKGINCYTIVVERFANPDTE